MKTATIITPFLSYSYPVRIKYLQNYLERKEYKVNILTSDFDHRKKKKIKKALKDVEYIETPKYKKNISFWRIYSHFIFAQRCFNSVKKNPTDLIYVSGPPNSLFIFFNKKYFKNSYMIFEVGDLWPESLPISLKLKRILRMPFSIWKKIRDKALPTADLIFYECQYFYDFLRDQGLKNTEVLYLTTEEIPVDLSKRNKENDTLSFLYLGSINNLIDINWIISFLKELKKKNTVIFHIVGDGEKKKDLIALLSNERIQFYDHGIVYDPEKKAEIFQNCDMALNIMKSTVEVGLTMKSLEYFAAGLPIINNIEHDSQKILLENECGITYKNPIQAAKKVNSLSKEELNRMAQNSKKAYYKLFSPEAFSKKLNQYI